MSKLRGNLGVCLAVLASLWATAVFAQERLKLSVMAPGTSSYLIMTNFAAAVNAGQDAVSILTDSKGVQTRHMLDVALERTDFALTSPHAFDHMRNGTGMYQQQARAPDLADDLRLLFWFPNGPYQVVVPADLGIGRLRDLKGLRIFLGPPGSDDFLLMRDWLFAAARLEFGVDYEPIAGSWLDALTGYRRGDIDVYITPGQPPHSFVPTLARGAPVRLLGLSREERRAIENDQSLEANQIVQSLGRSFVEIIEPAYDARVLQNGPQHALGSLAGLVVNRKMDEEQVYQIVKAFWSAKSDLDKRGEYMRTVSQRTAFSDSSIPLHPGALRYYREAGWTIPRELQ
ncbi:MAG: TAXI family TRAP transporter solute-binding subunit [Pseudomonadota bacterium]